MTPGDFNRRLAFRRALAWAALSFERLWPVLWPPIGVAGLFVCLALLDITRILPPLGQAALLGAALLGVVALLIRGLIGLRAPGREAVDRRLELASGLAHRPLSVLADRPAVGDATALAVWRAHAARAARQITRLRVGAPHPGLARLDRRALRGGLVVALVACAGVAGADAPARLGAALRPPLPRGTPVPATELQAWITPPAYTGVAPIFLKPETGTLSVPAGSHLTVSVTGGSGVPSLALGDRQTNFHPLDAGSFQADAELSESGRLVVRRDGSTLAGWDLTVMADQPPIAAWTAPPGPARARLHTRLPWRASDDYGVTALTAELRLAARPDAPALVVPVPLPGAAKDAHGLAEPDLSAHPWAGLPVIAHLVARDGAGQSGRSADAPLILPERSFRNKEAQALVAIRKGLSVNPGDRDDALAGLDALLVAPGSIGNDPGTFLNLSAIYYLLEFDHDPTAVAQAQERMWRLALQLEEGPAAQTERALQQAREAAEQALSRLRVDPSEANRADLEAKLRALRDAISKHMQALAQQMHGQQPGQTDPEARRLSARDLARMAQRAMDAARRGETEQAAQELAQLERALDALRDAKPMTDADRARAAERRKGREQESAIQDLLTRQGSLLDHAQERAREAARTGADPAGAKPARANDRNVQQALRRALGEVMQQLGDLTGKVPGSLGEADHAMEGAGQALAAGRDEVAQSAELKAIEALQKGGRDAAKQMANKFGAGRGEQAGQGQGEGQGDGQGDVTLSDDGGQPGDDGQLGDGGENGDAMGQGGRGRDPLGRQIGPGGQEVDESDVTVPDRAGPQRSEVIEQELRRRGADRARPREELDYIDRLLKQF
ncbi:MAG: DUF4175 family protein [Acetobacteraceae bacterium]